MLVSCSYLIILHFVNSLLTFYVLILFVQLLNEVQGFEIRV